ncbi:MAG: RNA methyltransferase [Zoogloeaceae bacterium]|jgi:TrmH family RNA methyltransferase|nr:RNA methyltransferase [Zoogloeaceae bacterium]
MKTVTSASNPHYQDWKKLGGSTRAQKKSGEILLEGMHLLDAWQAVYGLPLGVWVSESGIKRLEIAGWLADHAQSLRAPAEIFCSPDALFRKLADTETPAGIVARVPLPKQSDSPLPDVDTLLLDGIQDPGNLGCLLRTAAAAGFSQALLSAHCASAWSAKVLRAGQGAHFQARIYEAADLPAFLRAFKGVSLAATVQDAEPLHIVRWPAHAPLAWVFGAEGQGIGAATLGEAGHRVRIAMPGAMESLNVSAAAAICLFESLRRRQARK